MTTSKYYLTIVTKDKCPACDFLKAQHLQKIIQGSERTYLTPVRLFNFVNDQLSGNDKMPEDLKNYFYLVPAAILVTQETFELALQHPQTRLVAIPYNLRIDAQGRKLLEDPRKQIEEQPILDWLDKIVGKPHGNYEPFRVGQNDICSGSMGSRGFRFGV
jgi:hypothetical protein